MASRRVIHVTRHAGLRGASGRSLQAVGDERDGLLARPRRALAGALAIALLAGALAGAPARPARAAVEPHEELRRLQQEQEEFQRRLGRLRLQKDQKSREHQILTEELRSAENRLYRLTIDLDDLRAQLADAEARAKDAAARLAAAEAEWKRRNRLLGTRVRVIYELGAVSYLEVLLSATSFGDFLTRFTALRLILARDVEMFAGAREVRERIRQAKAEIDQRRAEIATYKQRTEGQKQAVQAAADLVAQRKAMTARDLELLEQQEEQLQRIAEEWSARIAALQAKLARKRTGKLAMIWPVRGPITSPFGMRIHPILGVPRGHTGMDIAAGSGTPIKAAESGVVIHSGWIDGYGYTTIIDHGDNVSTLYAHSSRLLKNAGDEVVQGETIALVGSTGWSTGPHLHFEVRVNGRVTDPAEWLP